MEDEYIEKTTVRQLRKFAQELEYPYSLLEMIYEDEMPSFPHDTQVRSIM